MSESGSILIVDDDHDIRALLATRLRGAGFAVDEASRGREGVEMIGRGTYDVVILDLMMPDMSGFEVLSRLQGESDMPTVIIHSAAGNHEDRMRGLYGGAMDFLSKPFDLDELVARVHAATRAKRALRAALRQAETDALTGIGNRRAFDERIKGEILRSRRYSHELSLILFDADGLKTINDSLGHGAGDRMLTIIGTAVASVGRSSDAAFRIGGDEFALILPETKRDEAEAILRRVREVLAGKSVSVGEVKLLVSVSAGVACFPADAFDSEALICAADQALYKNKRTRAESKHHEKASEATKVKLLVVEDDEDLAEILLTRLKGLGFSVRRAATRREGMNALMNEAPSLIILDLCLPDGSGIELLKEVRQESRLGKIPIIVLTGLGAPSQIVNGFCEGANAYLAKPCEPALLEAAINTLLAEAA